MRDATALAKCVTALNLDGIAALKAGTHRHKSSRKGSPNVHDIRNTARIRKVRDGTRDGLLGKIVADGAKPRRSILCTRGEKRAGEDEKWSTSSHNAKRASHAPCHVRATSPAAC